MLKDRLRDLGRSPANMSSDDFERGLQGKRMVEMRVLWRIVNRGVYREGLIDIDDCIEFYKMAEAFL